MGNGGVQTISGEQSSDLDLNLWGTFLLTSLLIYLKTITSYAVIEVGVRSQDHLLLCVHLFPELDF